MPNGLKESRAIYLGEVFEKRCNQCLFSDAKIVPDARKAEIIETCVKTDTHFICHKASLAGRDVCCRGFYDAHPGIGQGRRIGDVMGLTRFVVLPSDDS